MKKKNERGEVVIEASIVVTIVVVLITLMVYLGLVMYQKTLVTVMANQTASNLAQVYSNTLKDPFTGYIDSDNIYQTVSYNTIKNEAYRQVVGNKANIFAQYRLLSSAIIGSEKTSVDVQIVPKPGELLKCQIVVTVKEKFDVPLVGFFGISDNSLEFTAQGRADCVDVIEYLNGIEAVGEPENSPIQSVSDHYIVTFIVEKYSGKFHASEPVLCGESISSSNQYTHCSIPANPKFNGLEFTGWVTADGKDFTEYTKVESDITVYGSWLCEVTLDPGKGTVKTNKIKVPYNTPIVFKDEHIPSRGGYGFEGWFTVKEGKGEQYRSGVTLVKQNITLYAKWKCLHFDVDANKETFVLIRETPGDCMRHGVKYYECSRCGAKDEREGPKGGHNHQLTGNTGGRCYENKAVYTCVNAGCGNTYKRDIPGGSHSFQVGDGKRRCNIAHPTKYFECEAAGWNADRGKFNQCSTTTKYHRTCTYCGTIEQGAYYRGGRLIYADIWFCGIHGAGVATTGCGHSGTKK